MPNIMEAQYKNNGREFPYFDCYGLIKYMYKQEHGLDIIDFDYKDPNDPENEHYFIENMNHPRWIKTEAKKGSVVALKVNGYISHVGYMVSDTEFIHIMKNSGVVKAKINNPKWVHRIVGYYKYA